MCAAVQGKLCGEVGHLNQNQGPVLNAGRVTGGRELSPGLTEHRRCRTSANLPEHMVDDTRDDDVMLVFFIWSCV